MYLTNHVEDLETNFIRYFSKTLPSEVSPWTLPCPIRRVWGPDVLFSSSQVATHLFHYMCGMSDLMRLVCACARVSKRPVGV